MSQSRRQNLQKMYANNDGYFCQFLMK